MSDGKYSGIHRDGSPRRGADAGAPQRRPRRSAPDEYTPTPRHVMPSDEPELGRHAAPAINDDIFRRPGDDHRRNDDPRSNRPRTGGRHAPPTSPADPVIEPTRSSLRRSLLLTTASANGTCLVCRFADQIVVVGTGRDLG